MSQRNEPRSALPSSKTPTTSRVRSEGEQRPKTLSKEQINRLEQQARLSQSTHRPYISVYFQRY